MLQRSRLLISKTAGASCDVDLIAEPLPRNANGKILKPQVKRAMKLL